MGKALVVLLDLAFNLGGVGFAVAYFAQRRRIAGLDRPELWLSKKERRNLARQRISDAQMDHLTQMINERTKMPNEN